jgi:hypothetical protein
MFHVDIARAFIASSGRDGHNIGSLPLHLRRMNPLEESLHRMRAEIRSLDLGDEAARQRLEGLVREIEQTLGDPAERNARAGSLGDQLKASVLSFEASHPRLASVMNEVVEKLSTMGI